VKQSERKKGPNGLPVEREGKRKKNEAEEGGENQKLIVVAEEVKLVQTSDIYDLPTSSDPELGVEIEEPVEEKPLSRAERRRRIKEEIMAGSEEHGFKGYRRRMW
jgi:hypothetical protein